MVLCRSPSYYSIIDPKQKIINYYELKVVYSFFLQTIIGWDWEIQKKTLDNKNLSIFMKLKILCLLNTHHGRPMGDLEFFVHVLTLCPMHSD